MRSSFKIADAVDWQHDLLEAEGIHWRFESMISDKGAKFSHVYIVQYKEYKKTPRGFWVYEDGEQPTEAGYRSHCKLVLTDSRKKWAYPTKAEAWNSFRIRQQHRLVYANLAVMQAEIANQIVKEYDDNPSGGKRV